jgi:chromate reductase
VTRLEEVIRSADAVLFATPEYNYSVPGVLKNAIDHASRPAYHSVFRDKPCGILSATASFVGGARAQQHLKTILLGMGAALFPWPELLVGGAHGRFTGGQLTDEVTEKFLRGYVEGMVSWVQRMPAGATSRRS